MTSLRKLIVCVGAAAPMLWVSRGFSQTFTWTGGTNGSFSDAGNWSSGTVPGPFADIMIDGGAAQNSVVNFNIPTSIRNLQISTGDSAVVNDAVILTFGPGISSSVSGPGTITLGSSVGAQIAAQGTLNLAGGGVMNLNGFSQLNVNLRLNQHDFTIAGTGAVGAFRYDNSAAGLTRAKAPAGSSGLFATLFINAVEAENFGTFAAAGGSTLSISAGLFVNAGTLLAESGGTVLLSRDMVLNTGTFATQPGGLVIAPAFPSNNRITLNNMANIGEFRTERARNIVGGQLFNSGTFTLATPGASIELSGASTTFSGGGTLRLNDSYIAGTATSTLVNQNHAIRGYNQSGGVAVGTLINDGGTIEADVAGQRLKLAPGVSLINSGILSAANGGELLLGASPVTIDNRFGRISARGANSRVKLEQSTTIFGGTIETDALGEVVFDSPNGTFTIDNAVNSGRLRMQSGTLFAGPGGVLINSGTITAGTISLGGTITLAGTGQFDVNGWIQFQNGIINLANRIGGSGLIDHLDNRAGGIVDARGTGLVLRSGTKNSGLMRASNGGTLYISTVENTGGRIEAAANSFVRMDGTTNTGTIAALAGGSVSSSAGLYFRNGATLLGPGLYKAGNNDGVNFNLVNGESVAIGDNALFDRGTFTGAGASTVNLVGSNRSVTFKDFTFNAGAATLNFNDGSLNLQGQTVNRLNLHLRTTSGSPRLFPVGVATLSGAGTIYGAGGGFGDGRLVNLDNTIFVDSSFFGLWDGGWENYGTISGRGGNSSLYLRRGVSTINRGVISSGVLTHFQFNTSSSGTLEAVLDNAGGVIESVGNSTMSIESKRIKGGVLDSSGGTITAGTSGGTLTLEDVALRGTRLHTGVARIQLQGFVDFPSTAMITVGSPIGPGGWLHGTYDGDGLSMPGTISLRNGTIESGRFRVGGTIFGTGTIGNATPAAPPLFLQNSGTIAARAIAGTTGEQRLTLIATSGSGFENNGLLLVETGTIMDLRRNSSFIPADNLRGSGSIVIQSGGTFNSFVDVRLTGGVRNDGFFLHDGFILRAGDLTGTGESRFLKISATIDRIRQRSLSIEGTTLVRSDGTMGTSRVEQLTMTPTARLRIGGAWVVDYDGGSPADEIRALLTSGYAGGSWNGAGIAGAFHPLPGALGGMGYAEASDLGLANGIFEGEQLNGDAILMLNTLMGDANLDSAVNIADFSRLAANFNSPAIWSNGDFNYDGVANISDFALMASNFNLSLVGDLPRNLIPEPVGFSAIAAAWAITRRRRMIDRD